MSKPLTNDQVECIKQEMYDCNCDLELVIYMFKSYLFNETYSDDYRQKIFYQGILDYLQHSGGGY